MQAPMLGEVSGMDIHEMIDDLMELERKPIERKQEDIEEARETKEHWGEINTRLDSLQSAASPLLESETFAASQAESSNEEAVGASITGEPVEGEYEVYVDQLATRQMVASDPDQADPPDNGEYEDAWDNGRIADPHQALGLSGEFEIGAGEDTAEIAVNAEDSLQDIIDRINQETGEVSARWIQAEAEDYRLVLESRVEGEEGEITLNDFENEEDDQVMNDLGVLDNGDFAHELREAQNAELTLFPDAPEEDSFSVERSSNTIDDLIQGVRLDLREEGQTSTISVDQDVDGAVETVEEFIEEYNQTVDKIRDMRGIGGELQGDTTLSRIQSQMRTALQAQPFNIQIGGEEVSTLYGLGFDTTGEGDIKSEGHLEIKDEDQLRAAIRSNPEGVHQLLAGEGNDEEEPGILRQLDEVLDTYLEDDGIIEDRKDRYDNRVDRLQDRILDVEERVSMREERLRQQFIDMELALSQMEQQSDFLEDFMGV